MKTIFCPKCGFPLETESVKNVVKDFKPMFKAFMECKNCHTHFDTPNINKDESWKKKQN